MGKVSSVYTPENSQPVQPYPFLGHRVGAIAMQHAEIEVVVLRQMRHAGDAGLLQGAVI